MEGLSQSRNAEAGARALSLTGWSSQAPQAAGMWFQVELPKASTITEIQFSSPNAGRGGGGGGRAAAPPAAAPGAPAAAGGGAGALVGRAGGSAGAAPNPGYPRGYKVETSLNGTTWTPVATGAGAGATTTITFKPTAAKFVRLTQTATVEAAPPLSIQQFRLYESPAPAGK